MIISFAPDVSSLTPRQSRLHGNRRGEAPIDRSCCSATVALRPLLCQTDDCAVTLTPYERNLDRNPANFQPLTPLSFLARAAQVFPEQTAIIHTRLDTPIVPFRREMRQSPLTPIFKGADYIARCLAAATVEEKYERLIEPHLSMLESTLTNFRQGLVKRFGEERSALDVDPVLAGLQLLREMYPWR